MKRDASSLQVPIESYAINMVAEQDANISGADPCQQICLSVVFAIPMHKPGMRLAASRVIATMREHSFLVQMQSATESFALTATGGAISTAHIMVSL